jgi:hypothetical protein
MTKTFGAAASGIGVVCGAVFAEAVPRAIFVDDSNSA